MNYKEILSTTTDKKIIIDTVKSIQVKHRITNTKLALIIGCSSRSGVTYKLKNGNFLLCEINKILHFING